MTSQNENVPPSTRNQGATKLSQRSVYSSLPVEHSNVQVEATLGSEQSTQQVIDYPTNIEADCIASIPSSFELSTCASGDECKSQSFPAIQYDDSSHQVNILSVHEVVHYTISTFSIVTVKLRRVRATIGTTSNIVDIYLLNENERFPNEVPLSITVDKKCTVEVRNQLVSSTLHLHVISYTSIVVRIQQRC